MLELPMEVVGIGLLSKKEEKEKRKERNGNITNEEGPAEENEIDPAQERNEADPEPLGEYGDVNYTGSEYESLSGLDSGEVGNYGGYSEVEQFLQHNEGTHGYEALRSPSDVDVFRIFAKEQILRERERQGEREREKKGKSREILADSIRNRPGQLRGEMVFGKCRQTLGIGERKKPFEEKQARLAKMEGWQLKGDSEQRRSGGVAPEIKRLDLSAEIQIILRRNVQSGSERKKGWQKKEKQQKGRKGKERKDL